MDSPTGFGNGSLDVSLQPNPADQLRQLLSRCGMADPGETIRDRLLDRIKTRRARVAIVGLGYVGLPLAIEFGKRFHTVGIDLDRDRAEMVAGGRSPIGDVDEAALAQLVSSGRLTATSDFSILADSDCAIVCVPTPLGEGKRPDISHIIESGKSIASHLHPGQLVVLESTTYPGTTDEKLLPILCATGLKLDQHFLLAFSPERIDPGNPHYDLSNTPKIVGGTSPSSLEVAAALYQAITPFVLPVSSTRVAEAAKLWENTFRMVNIALANEMAMLCHRFGIDSSEVIDAAATKPFGFMPFYPGPGVGGHCIPLDPMYLSWKATEHGYTPGLVVLSEQINSSMPDYVVQMVVDALNDSGSSRSLRGARILIVGVTYKAEVEDTRHSPALTVIERLRGKGSVVRYHDPFAPRLSFSEDTLPPSPYRDRRSTFVERRRQYVNGRSALQRRRLDPLSSVELSDEELATADCVVIATAHKQVDYERIGRTAKLIVDTRNAMPRHDGITARVFRL